LGKAVDKRLVRGDTLPMAALVMAFFVVGGSLVICAILKRK